MGRHTIRFSRKNSNEIIANFGVKAFNDELDMDEDLRLPGMKRGLIVENLNPASSLGGTSEDPSAGGRQQDDSGSLFMQQQDHTSQQSSFDQPSTTSSH